jgi:hypothetical protein
VPRLVLDSRGTLEEQSQNKQLPGPGERSPAVKINFQWKDDDSNIGGCPAQYKVTSTEGGYVIQGKRLDAETRAQLRDLALDEDAVWVPDNVIDRNR